jgi:hypothetical protein
MNTAATMISMAAMLGGVVVASDASAAQLGFYGGAYVAQTDPQDITVGPFDDFSVFVYDQYGFTPTATRSSLDTKDTVYGFNIGYRWLRNFAVEASYMNLGTVSYRNRSDGIDTQVNANATWLQNVETSSSAITLSGLGILPVGEAFEMYARGGLLITNNHLRVFISDGQGSDQLQITGSGTSLLAGVGASLNVLEIYQIRLEFQRAFDAGDDDVAGKSDIDMISLGFTASF